MSIHELTGAIDVQPGSLLVAAPADTTIEQLGAALAPHGLCLPVFPLVAGLTLAELVANNAGGRRRLRYGPIGRHLRAAVLDPRPADGAALEPLTIGGPTIKRATGYGLHRAIAGGALGLGAPRELTFSLRPIPAARAAILLACPDLAAACRLAARLYAGGLVLSALAVLDDGDGPAMLLAELEGAAPVVARQAAVVEATAAEAGARPLPQGDDPWLPWERAAAAHGAAAPQTSPPPRPARHPLSAAERGAGGEVSAALDLTLPRAALPEYVERARAIASRYGLPLTIWGDAGVGALHLTVLAPGRAAEAQQLLLVLRAIAAELGGALSTEFGRGAGERGSGGAGERGSAELASSRPISGSPGLRVSGSPGLRVSGSPGLRAAAPSYTILAELRAVVGAPYLLTGAEDRSCYETDASIARPLGEALAVALPADTAEVAALVRIAAANGLPVVTRGAGSGLAGGATPSAGALVISLNRLEQIAVDAEQMTAHVGAGAITAEVQRAAEAAGLLYPPDPSSQAASTIGGNIACNAGGPRCVKYGVTADYVLDVTVVLADGTVARWGDGLAGQGPDSALAQLMVGSEGTLGIITEATLRLIPAPPARRTTMALFHSLEAACATVEQIMAAGLVPAGLELMDDACIAAVEGYLGLGLPRDTGAMLLMLADGEPEAVDAEAVALAELARAGGATSVQVAQSAADEANLWKARRAVSIALTRVRPNRLGEDICVPLDQIAAFVRQVKAVSAEHGLPIVVFGHAGDGNLHPNILFDGKDPAETARIWPCAEAVFGAALAAGGTLSGEHGIGTLKKPFMAQALGAASLAAQRRIKAAFDPAGLLNPGKVLPDG